MRNAILLLVTCSFGFSHQNPLRADYALPRMGGGSVSQGNAPMKHIVVTQSGTTINIVIDDFVDTPLLRELEAPDEFDPLAPWAVLQGKAHNFQYGWLASGVWTLPAGSGVFVEKIDAPAELETYFVDGSLLSNSYDPIFGTGGSADVWQWSGEMIHNSYAVAYPTSDSYVATYLVYYGDASTGAPLSGYQSAEVTLTFDATPVLTADFNGDTYVDGSDLNTWQSSYGATTGVTNSMGDADLDGDVDGIDFLRWQVQHTGGPPAINAVPEPGTVALLFVASTLGLQTRSRRGL